MSLLHESGKEYITQEHSNILFKSYEIAYGGTYIYQPYFSTVEVIKCYKDGFSYL